MDWKPVVLTGLLLLLFFLLPLFQSILGGFIHVLTEGNSPIKQAGFLFFLFLFFGLKVFLPKPILSFFASKRTIFENLLLLVISAGFFASLAVQVYTQSALGGNSSSYVSLVTDCGPSVCWEASYFQHTHLMKSGIYFLEKNVGALIPADADNGKPVYEMLSYLGIADFAGLLSLVLLGLIFLFTFAASLAEKDDKKSVWLFLAGLLSLFAILDGGFFSLTGIAAFSLLLLTYTQDVRLHPRLDRFRPLLILLVVLFFSWLPFLFLQTQLYFREWFVAPLFLCTLYWFFQQKTSKNNKRLFTWSALLLVVSLFFVASDTLRHGFGEEIQGRFLVYGLPSDAIEPQITSASHSLLHARYGWYALLEKNTSFNTNQMEETFRKDLNPRGYLLVEGAQKQVRNIEISIVWLSPPVSLQDTASYAISSQFEFGSLSLLKGKSTLSGPQLALELGSSIYPKYGKAIVITNVI